MANSKTRGVPVPIRPRRTPRRAHWQALLEACRRSGLSQAAFCRRRGIPPGTLAFWKHTLAREAHSSPAGRPVAPTFVPVRVVASPSPPDDATPSLTTTMRGEIELVLTDGHRVRVRGPVDVRWLGQVVRMLATLGC